MNSKDLDNVTKIAMVALAAYVVYEIVQGVQGTVAAVSGPATDLESFLQNPLDPSFY